MVTELVDKATNELLIQTDWTTVLQISDILNRDPVHARGVVRQITKKLKDRSRVILLALELADSLLQNCQCTHVYFAERTFQTELCRLIMNKKTKLNVKEKTLEIVESWGNAFQARHDVPGFYETYSFIKRSGYKFPPRPNDAPILNFNHQPQKRTVSGSILTNPNGSSTSSHSLPLPGGTTSASNNNHTSSGGSGGSQPIKNQEISSIKGSTSVFNEMISFLNVEEEDPQENDLIKELFETCKQSQLRVKEMIESGTASERDLAVLLKLNDEINNALNDYEASIKRRRAFVDGGFKPLSAPPQSNHSNINSNGNNNNNNNNNNRNPSYLTKHKELEEIDFFKAPDGVSPYSVQQQLQTFQQSQQPMYQQPQQQQQQLNNFNPFAQPSPQFQQQNNFQQQQQQQQQQLQRMQAGSKADDFDIFVANRQNNMSNINNNPFANANNNNSNNTIQPYVPSAAKSLPSNQPLIQPMQNQFSPQQRVVSTTLTQPSAPPPFNKSTQSNPFSNSPPLMNQPSNTQPMYNNANNNNNGLNPYSNNNNNNTNNSIISSNYPNYNAIRTDQNQFNNNPYGMMNQQPQQQQQMMMGGNMMMNQQPQQQQQMMNGGNNNFSPTYSQFTNYAQNQPPYNFGMNQPNNMYSNNNNNNMSGKSSLM